MPETPEKGAAGGVTGEVLSGHCLCGAARFTARPVKDHADACHCVMCRRWGAGPFIGVEVSGLAFAADAPLIRYTSSEWGERISCAKCGSALAWRMQDGSMETVPTGAFDPPLDLPLAVEIFIDQKPAGYSFAGDRHRMTAADVAAAFGKDG